MGNFNTPVFPTDVFQVKNKQKYKKEKERKEGIFTDWRRCKVREEDSIWKKRFPDRYKLSCFQNNARPGAEGTRRELGPERRQIVWGVRLT